MTRAGNCRSDSVVGVAGFLGEEQLPGLDATVEGSGGLVKKEFSFGCSWSDELVRMP